MENVKDAVMYGKRRIHLRPVYFRVDIRIWFAYVDDDLVGLLILRNDRFVFYPLGSHRKFTSKYRFRPIERFLDLLQLEKLQEDLIATNS